MRKITAALDEVGRRAVHRRERRADDAARRRRSRLASLGRPARRLERSEGGRSRELVACGRRELEGASRRPSGVPDQVTGLLYVDVGRLLGLAKTFTSDSSASDKEALDNLAHVGRVRRLRHDRRRHRDRRPVHRDHEVASAGPDEARQARRAGNDPDAAREAQERAHVRAIDGAEVAVRVREDRPVGLQTRLRDRRVDAVRPVLEVGERLRRIAPCERVALGGRAEEATARVPANASACWLGRRSRARGRRARRSARAGRCAPACAARARRRRRARSRSLHRPCGRPGSGRPRTRSRRSGRDRDLPRRP